ncbi:hypothetical protein BZA77DRAFT_363423 [Pyronema omphalodes]|nr:hypothetical protein BZA77DRAFT_363423 [Pyronema omphalodes]
MSQPDEMEEPVRLIRRGKRITVSRPAGRPRPAPAQPYSDLLIDVQEVPDIVISDPNDFPPATFLRPLTPTTPTGGMPLDTSGYPPPNPYFNSGPPPPSPVNSIHSITSSVEREFAWEDDARAFLASGVSSASGQSSRASSRGPENQDRLTSPSVNASRPAIPARDPRYDPNAGPEIRREMMERIQRFALPEMYPSSPVTAGIFALSMPAAQRDIFMKDRPLPPDPAVAAQEAADAEVAEFAPSPPPSPGNVPVRSPVLPPNSGWKPVPKFTPLREASPEVPARDEDGRPIFAPKGYYHPYCPSLNYSMFHLMEGWENIKISAEAPDLAIPQGLEYDVNTHGKLSKKHGDMSAAVKPPNRFAHLGKMVKVPAKGSKPGGRVRSRWRKEDSLIRSDSLTEVHNVTAKEGEDTSMTGTNTGIPTTPRLSPKGTRISPDGTPDWDEDLIDLINEPPPSPIKRQYFSSEDSPGHPDHGLFNQNAFPAVGSDTTMSKSTNPKTTRHPGHPGKPWEFAEPAKDDCRDYPWPPRVDIPSIMKRPFQLSDSWDDHPAASDPTITSVEDFLSVLDDPDYIPSNKPRPMTRGDRIKASAAKMADSASWQTVDSMGSGGGDPDSPSAKIKAKKEAKEAKAAERAAKRAAKKARRRERAKRIVKDWDTDSSSDSELEDSDSDSENRDSENDEDIIREEKPEKNEKASSEMKNRRAAETTATGELSGHFVEGMFVELAGLHINGKQGPDGPK